ncbi:hypothetical protein [Paenibacillus sp. NPDC057967]|uniref:hypothetical protein n=1 Tax=Paenibacillus sp. NPDC057967 TaxID=3346293 RepID=UPI0036DE0BCB
MNPSMRKSLRMLGWGLVFPILDLHLGPFDVLPDFIGYIMILVALNQLGTGDGGFKPASWLAAGLILLSLPQLVIKSSIDIDELIVASLGMYIFSQGMMVLHALLAYFIVRGLYTIARPIAPPKLLNALVSRLRLYLALMAAQLIFYPFLLNFGEDLAVLLLLIGIVKFIAELMLIRIPFRISHIRNAPVHHDNQSGAAPL